MELSELYQELILDHGRHPRNHEFPEPSNREGRGYNPLCGDKITVRMQLDGEVITDIGFRGEGCAISQASSSTMTEAVKGKTVEEAERIFEDFHALVMGQGEADIDKLGKLAAFAGVSAFPMRVKCATLAWHTLKQAIANKEHEATTE